MAEGNIKTNDMVAALGVKVLEKGESIPAFVEGCCDSLHGVWRLAGTLACSEQVGITVQES